MEENENRKMPPYYGSKPEYLIWRACERVGIRPPGVMDVNWNDQGPEIQAKILAYESIRSKDK